MGATSPPEEAEMSDPRPQETRRYPRVASENVVLVQSSDPDEAGLFAKTRALGAGGCSFVAGEAPAAGTVVDVLLSLGGRIVRARSRVVYVNPSGDRNEGGVEFLELEAEDREHLDRYFARRTNGA
jgi:c-di-GMP-binding flagellar brake protein YcgR